MKYPVKYILLTLVLIGTFTSCNVVKRVGENQFLLTDAAIEIDGKKTNREEINNLLYQRRNTRVLGVPLRLHIYNLARPNRDSLFEAWLDKNPKKRARMNRRYSKKQVDKLKESALGFNNWLKNTGEPPTIIDSVRTNKSVQNLKDYYFINGWFDREVSYKLDTVANKRAKLTYSVAPGEPYFIDSVSVNIASNLIDSLYTLSKDKSLIKSGQQFKVLDFEKERERLNDDFRNLGVFHFSEDYIEFENDTIGKNKKVDVAVQIKNRIIRNEDSTARVPFKMYNIRDVNIITDDAFENRGKTFSDSISYENYKIWSYGKMRYKAKALTDAILISKGKIFRDIDRTYTFRYLNELQTFKYPNIEYVENEEDTTLTANIYLSPRKKFGLGFDFNISQSNIQTVGLSFSTSLLTRNVFRGAETLEISAIGSIGASKDGSENDQQFFDINEIGANLRLTIPRFFFPINTEKIIPKYMSPSSRVSLGFTSQANIGLDKQTVNGILNYRWYPSQSVTNGLDLFSAQYVRNLNPGNYFSVYQNSFNRLEDIAVDVYNTPSEFIETVNGEDQLIQDSADEFIDLVLADSGFETSNPDDYQQVNNINERKERLTENNLIFATNFSYSKDKRENVFDEDFSIFRFKVEFAGNLLSTISKLIGEQQNSDDKYELFNVAFSQYAKTEFDYIKHWDLGRQNVFAFRSFFGIAIPYGNSTSIPFAKSFFAGGTNDNRAWTAYNLGPGSSDSNDEFNEANLKLALSMEYRFNLFGRMNGALFIDAGNIWNVLDDVETPGATFDGFGSLKDIAVGSGFGMRYDFGFFVLRGDIGFKTYDPSYQLGNRWFNEFNFANAVYNVGINYPF
ncbi:MAG: BamA/TamA family outer membrane protein [Flavobacteriaceae bacterium]|nr:BamA/TamA family outer membrane protein [Flavobacteriaceae bacterium]